MNSDIGWASLILAAIAAVAAVAIGSIVWFSERTNRLRTTFLWLTVFVGLWIVCNVLYSIVPSEARYQLALMSYAAAVFVVVTTLAFAIKLVKRTIGEFGRLFLAIGYIAGIVAALPGVIGLGIEGFAIVTRPAGILAYGCIIIGYLLSACVLLIMYAKSRDTHRILRRQIKYVLYGVIVASIIGLTFNLVLPILGEYRFTELGPAGATVFIVFIAYSIARYSLFDIRFAIVRAVAYGATLASLIGVYLLLVFLVTSTLHGTFSDSRQVIFNSIAALIMATLLPFMKRFFDKVTDKVFYRDNYRSGEFYTSMNKILSVSNDLRSLLSRVSHLISETLKADQVFFFVYTDDAHHMSVGTREHARLALGEARMLDERVRALGDDVDVLLETRLTADDDLRRMMVSHRIALVLPLSRANTMVGYLCLGERRSGAYTQRDLTVLSTIADELVIAIQNAQSVQEVKDLNQHLEQRINAATKELRASNAQLQRLDEIKDEFISMASHQLRTPLTSIKGYLSMLIEGDVGEVTEDQKHLLNEAFISSERMVRLIGDFLNVSRLQTGKFMIDKHPVDLAKLVQREVEGLTVNAAAKNLKFVYKAPKNIPLLNLDENKIQQVVMNFADNAIYYSKEKGKITITLKKIPGFVEFTVKDNGIGVPEKEQAHLFHKFFRATNARRARPDGTGVGLFLAQKVVSDHGGTILFESKEGKGSTFGFRLPLPKE